MKLGTLRTSSLLALCAMAAIGSTASAADNNYTANLFGINEARAPASITLSADVNPIALDAIKKTSKYASACMAGCTCASCAGATKHYTGLKYTGVDKVVFQHAFLITTEASGAVYLMDAKGNGVAGGITKMKATTDLAPPAKKSLWVNVTNGGGSGCDVAHDGSSDKVRGTGQQYGANMAHRRGVVIAGIERPDASA